MRGTLCSRQVFVLFFLCLWLFIASPGIVMAHKVNIYAYAEKGMIYTESYFGDGSRVKNATIGVFNSESGKKMFDVKTDNSGCANFKIPGPFPVKLVLNASMGHRNSYVIKKKEIMEGLGMEQVPRPVVTVKHESAGRTAPDADRRFSSEECREITSMVDMVVERRLQPIKRMLLDIRQSSDKPGVSEILGGIGYIMGLMGIALYFKSRQKK